MRGFVRRWSVGVLALIIGLNLGIGVPNAESSTLSETDSQALQQGAMPNDADSQQTYVGLSAHMTNYRLTRSRLSVPHIAFSAEEMRHEERKNESTQPQIAFHIADSL